MSKKLHSGDYYCTTFCNFAHSISTGRPIGHECHILPSAMLRAEMAGDIEGALEILRIKGKGPIVVGRAGRFADERGN